MDDLAGMRPRWLVRPLVWVADKMTGPAFILQFVVFLALWMGFNMLSPYRFDKAPFIGLNLFMSALAGIQAAVIGVKQTVSDYKRTQADMVHQDKYDRLIEHIADLEDARAADAKRREELQNRIVDHLKSMGGTRE